MNTKPILDALQKCAFDLGYLEAELTRLLSSEDLDKVGDSLLTLRKDLIEISDATLTTREERP